MNKRGFIIGLGAGLLISATIGLAGYISSAAKLEGVEDEPYAALEERYSLSPEDDDKLNQEDQENIDESAKGIEGENNADTEKTSSNQAATGLNFEADDNKAQQPSGDAAATHENPDSTAQPQQHTNASQTAADPKPAEQQPAATPKPAEQQQPAATPKPAEQQQPAATSKPAEQQQPAATPKPAEQQQPAATPKPAEQQQSTSGNQVVSQQAEASKTVQVTIGENTQSADVASKLKNEGIIQNEKEFSDYMDSKGLYIQYKPGTYEIKSGSTYDEILDEFGS